MRRTILGTLLAANLIFAGPAIAGEERTTALGASTPPGTTQNLSALVDGSLEQLTCDVEAWQLRLHRNFAPDAGSANEQAGEVVTTLLMNGLSQVPSGGTLEIDFRDGDVSVWIPNERVAFDTERTAVDPSGNSYRIVTRAGLGSQLSSKL